MELSGGDTAFVRDLLITYIEDAQNNALRLKELNENKDLQGIRFVVHKLRSSAGSVGAAQTATSAAELEKSIENTENYDESVFLTVEKLLGLILYECDIIQNEIAKLQNENGRTT